MTVCTIKPYTKESLAAIRQSSAMVPRPFVIKEINWETGAGDVYTWELEALDGEPLVYKPGQFNMLYQHGQGEVPISIASDYASGRLIHTTRAVGGVTRGMQRLKKGDVIGLRGPFGSHWPVEEAYGKDLIILTGGMGLPPLRPVIYQVLRERSLFRNVFLLYGARTPLDIVYRPELERWHLQKNIEVLVTVDKPAGQWNGEIGVVPGLLSRIQVDTTNSLAMMCGPEVMMHFSRLALQKLGMKDEQIYVSMERNMKCAVGHCGHCQWGPHFICKSGPVFRFDKIRDLFSVHEL